MTDREQSQPAGAESIRRSLDMLQRWVETQNYRGYEPFDGLSSWARPLAFGNLLGERLLMQLVRQSPVNLRPLLGISRKESTKGRGYMAWGYLILYRVTGQNEYLTRATECLRWLDQHKVARFRHHSWSNHFDFSSRSGGYTRNDPIIVWTAQIGQAYLEAFEATRQEWFLDRATSACRWILEVPRERTPSGDCLSYFADRQSSVHNANMLGAALLARTAKHTGDPDARRVARAAVAYTCSRQQPDGSWRYGEEANQPWIDNFHTGYILDSLKWYSESTGDDEFRPNLAVGLSFFKDHFFEPSGRPKYYHNRTYPVDIQCAAQAIETLAFLSDDDPACLGLARKVADWTIRHLQDPRGFFYYRQYPLVKARTPMLHWGQATMFKGLAVLLERLSELRQPGEAGEASARRVNTGSAPSDALRAIGPNRSAYFTPSRIL